MKTIYATFAIPAFLLCGCCGPIVRQANHKPQESLLGQRMFAESIKRHQPPAATIQAGQIRAESFKDLLATTGLSQSQLDSTRAQSAAFTAAAANQFENSRPQGDYTQYFTNLGQFGASNHVTRGVALTPDARFHYMWKTGMLKPTAIEDSNDQNEIQFCDDPLKAKGSGFGWIRDEFAHGLPGCCDDQVEVCSAEYHFAFIPQETATYTITATAMGCGYYYVVSDDGWPDSKEAWFDLSAEMGLSQILPTPVLISPGIYAQSVLTFDFADQMDHDGGDNVYRSAKAFGIKTLSITARLVKDVMVEVSVEVEGEVYARGDGSVATLDLTKNGPGVIWCHGFNVQRVGPP